MMTSVKDEKSEWWVGYMGNGLEIKCSVVAKTEADARAKMLIYLREKK